MKVTCAECVAGNCRECAGIAYIRNRRQEWVETKCQCAVKAERDGIAHTMAFRFVPGRLRMSKVDKLLAEIDSLLP